MKLKIDFHVHSYKSFDCFMSYDQIIKAAKKRGLDGVCICDHACTDISESLGNNNDDFIIIPAVEFTTGKNHIIGMFLEHEPVTVFGDKLDVPIDEIIAKTHQSGGICILAHPFQRLKSGVSDVSLQTDNIMKKTDGMEVYNSRAPYKYPRANKLAAEKADILGTVCRVAGSDAHLPDEIGNAYCTVDTPSRSLSDIKKAVLDGKVEITGSHCKRTSVTRSELNKSIKTGGSFVRKLKLYISYPLRYAVDIFDSITGRKL
ncbi:MAG: hypothetical protein E7588_01175 [Ruminococcaceae bacterium]|nr:hypothetical protein [Oscillospiraceae bacterium]